MSPIATSTVDIVDIRGTNLQNSLSQDIYHGLQATEKSLPTLLLYDTKGLRLFEDITYLDEYYLTNAEIKVLEANAAKIAALVPENCQLVELGSGNLRKIEILLNELERARKSVEYYALDLSLEELHRTFAELPSKSYRYVKCRGFWGTYDDGLNWLNNPSNRSKPTWVMSLGSSMGNFNPVEAAGFLRGFARSLGPADSMVIAFDPCKDPERVFRAYNDGKGVTRQFYLNGLSNANTILGFEAFKLGEWEAIGEFDQTLGCHKAYYVPLTDTVINDIHIKKGEKIFFEQAFKYGADDCEKLWRDAGLQPTRKFGDDYNIHILSSTATNMNPYQLPTKRTEYVKDAVPTLGDFEAVWKLWDTVTTSMVPHSDLLSRPIRLRNSLIFYLGHIPAFLDRHLSRATGGVPTEPAEFHSMFERGIDPDVDNPDHCHDHSAIPDEWPAVETLVEYQRQVRIRAKSVYHNGQIDDRKVAEALWISFEHETMHLETFLYMLLQGNSTLPPPLVARPDFKQLASDSAEKAVPNEWFKIPEQTVEIGLDEPGSDEIPSTSFGWDNEKPRRTAHVPSFVAKARPVTNGEYAKYLEENDTEQPPASWVESSPENGSNDTVTKYAVRTVFGPVPLEWAMDWPVAASYDELHRYAKWMKCRIPTFEETRSLYKYSLSSPTGNSEVSNGLMESMNGSDKRDHISSHQPVQTPSSVHKSVYVDLDDCNVGFNHWHPTSVTQNGDKLSGQGNFGGVWEWTSSTLETHDGFKAMDLYPAYTADFFDGKHNIVLGGSWATHPRLAGRSTFVNWYQRNYPYVWAGARLVRDD
ncbi:meiotically up-regulated 158 protein [Nannizzia gypsea CBS 118893]|uniref:Meiotically up-regulated 158 protein n=1 Tax=Arthroderma gypseum (strain ATCC MYA-4604 / CBS 118893) TaxID=535722 RepID=E4UVR5_ARTGP|nr:meiotically up-regulated 158 protein [Nannizzia gypsea CBS 118893]EFR02392.1 meiotically up-regulated 158 protein [Nannizzia gypsea CBS 118893]